MLTNDRMINGKTAVYGLLGDPVAKSLSPLLQNALAGTLGEDMVYVPFPGSAHTSEEMHALLGGAFSMGIAGMNVTIPYKSAVLPQLVYVEETARQIGAVNTLVRDEARGGYAGYNTDILGLERDLTEHGVRIEAMPVIILGAGGAARAAAFWAALRGAGPVLIANRTAKKAIALAEEVRFAAIKQWEGRASETGEVPQKEPSVTGLDLEALDGAALADLLPGKAVAIQCTAAGYDAQAGQSPVGDSFFEHVCFAYDIVYHPAETVFLQKAKAHGVPCAGGLGMLLYQGVEAFRIWRGKEVPAEVCRAARLLLEEKLRT